MKSREGVKGVGGVDLVVTGGALGQVRRLKAMNRHGRSFVIIMCSATECAQFR
jgi:hypothetical protein